MHPRHAPPSLYTDETLLDELSSVEYAALQWSVRTGNGLSALEQQQRDAWLDADACHRQAFDEFQAIHATIDALPAKATAQLQASVALETAAVNSSPSGIVAHTAAHSTIAHRNAHQQRRRWLAGGMLAASMASLLGATGWLSWQHWQAQVLFGRHYETGMGQQLTASLPDGSQIVADSSTQFQVKIYRHQRVVTLHEGQAVFKVAADPARPFIVTAGAVYVTVTGTRFSVRHIPSLDGGRVHIGVEQGSVHVTAQHTQRAMSEGVALSAGQAVYADDQGALSTVAALQPGGFAAWQAGRINLDNVPLSQALAELARYGEHGITLQHDGLAQMRITASISLRDVQGFLRSLPQVLPVRLEYHGSGVRIMVR